MVLLKTVDIKILHLRMLHTILFVEKYLALKHYSTLVASVCGLTAVCKNVN